LFVDSSTNAKIAKDDAVRIRIVGTRVDTNEIVSASDDALSCIDVRVCARARVSSQLDQSKMTILDSSKQRIFSSVVFQYGARLGSYGSTAGHSNAPIL
jgi:hypothetical protein